MSEQFDLLRPAVADDDLTTGLLVGLLAVLLLGLALILPATCRASSRWSAEVEARLLAAWPDIEAAAEAAGVPADSLAAQAATETGARPLEGWYGPVVGVLQVRPHTWRRLLWAEGWDDSDLMHPVWGWYAAASVLAYLRHTSGRDGDLLLCLWSDGWRAMSYRKDCLYSRQVGRLQRHVRGMGVSP